MMKKYTSVLFVIILFANGCSSDASNVVAKAVSIDDFLSISCTELENSKNLYFERVSSFWRLQDGVATRDKIVVGFAVGSLMIFFPLLFILSADDYYEELANAKGQYMAIDTVYNMKNCEASKK